MSEAAPLHDLVELRGDKIASAKDPQLPYVGLEHISQNTGDIVGSAPSASSVSINNLFASGDILFGKLRPNLRKCAQATFAGYCSTDLLVFRAKPGTDPGFAARTLQSEKVFSEALRTAEGTKMPRTSWSALQRLVVFHPPIHEQRRIAGVLNAVDTAIRSTESLIAKLGDLRQGLLHDLLTLGIGSNGEIRDPSDHGTFVSDPSLGLLPASWVARRFKDLAPVGRPHLKTGPFGSELKGEDWVESGVPVVTIGSLGSGDIIPEELLFISRRKASALASYALGCGDIVFSRVADVGRSLVIRDDQAGWVMSSNLMRISLDVSAACPTFVHYALTSCPSVRRQIRANVNASGRDVATAPILNRLTIPVPPLEEQIEIVRRVDSSSLAVRKQTRELEKLRSLKIGIMDDLLGGHLRMTGDWDAV